MMNNLDLTLKTPQGFEIMRWRHASYGYDLFRIYLDTSFRDNEAKKFSRCDAKHTLLRIQSDIVFEQACKDFL